MRTLTATQASRGFSALLDDIERNAEPVVIERDGVPVAQVMPFPLFNAGGLRRELVNFRGSGDDSLGQEIASVRAQLTLDNPWSD
ncbi:MAG: type II toxin-antitoxin system Phd/YefM family antitoxin [Cellulomonadaceae bacterium]|jgi:PHD/YefM family antitoxin component YafN of YafNO toxin-antitoxin module|nr:type II toxin-antitoxin system Phd/YefM family antitoxin [Cellulomonadaceae bacterium]